MCFIIYMRFEFRPSPPLRQVVARNAALAPVPVCVFVAGALAIKAEDPRRPRTASPELEAAELISESRRKKGRYQRR